MQTDPQTGLHHIRHKSGKMLKVADLVEDDEKTRNRVMETLRNIKDRDDVDMIIALGMAKEGFDWPFCEHALTVGYRGSLTEIIQIIGRATRDSPGKSHAQFTNLIAEPDASADNVADAVNNMLKAIAASLLMEQVLAPNFKFKTRPSDDNIDGGTKIVDIDYTNSETTVAIKGFAEPSTPRVRQILESDLVDLTASVMQDDRVLRAAMNSGGDSAGGRHTGLRAEGYRDEISRPFATGGRGGPPACRRQRGLQGELQRRPAGAEQQPHQDGRQVRQRERPRHRPDRQHQPVPARLRDHVEVGRRRVLKRIHGAITARRIQMTEEEAVALWPRIKSFNETHGREPSLTAQNPMERRLAEALEWIRAKKRERLRAQQSG